MKNNIVVAGAGHGGLVAAARLAAYGFDVTVIEKKSESELGHDWEDRFTFELLEKETGIRTENLPENSWRYRGDCVFISPSHRTGVVINYTDETRQKIMKRKTLISVLVEHARRNNVNFRFETGIKTAITENGRVVGVETESGEKIYADLVIDAAGCSSPVRRSLPDQCGVGDNLKRGDVFYAWRGYFNKLDVPETGLAPFEVYLYHECEQGLSWCCTNEDSVDILIGRIDPIDSDKVNEQLAVLRKNHPWIGDTLLNGGDFGIIPVRQPLSVMVADGYAAVGDSAFMTTPMNGMGIDLSVSAGILLAETVKKGNGDFTKYALWPYNRDYHRLYGGKTAKNEGLKNSLLELEPQGVDFLFDNGVIQSSDLGAAGKNTSLSSLLGKLVRGMKKPKYFFAVIGGLIRGAGLCKAFEAVPQSYDDEAIKKWKKKIEKKTVIITRRV